MYGEATLFLVKELRAEGLDASYLDSAENRVFEVKKSALVDALISIPFGIVGSAAWDGIKLLLRRKAPAATELEITFTDMTPGGTGRTWRVRGRPDDVLDAVDRLLLEPGDAAD